MNNLITTHKGQPLRPVHGSGSSKEGKMSQEKQLSVVVATVASRSRQGVFYEIRETLMGTIYCTCPAWMFQKLPVEARTCKHIAEYRKQHGQATV